MSDYQHIWTITVVNGCNPSHPRDYNYAASAQFDEALAAGKELLAKKHPNTYKEKCPEYAWHPDLELIGIKRGLELDNDEETPW